MKRATWVALLALITAACHQHDVRQHPPAAPNGSFVQIISVTPSLGTALLMDEQIDLSVDVDYTFNGESGTLNLVVQAADGSSLAKDMDVVLKGSGKVTLATSFKVPNTKAIQIFTALAAQGQTGTSTVDMRAFKVVQN